MLVETSVHADEVLEALGEGRVKRWLMDGDFRDQLLWLRSQIIAQDWHGATRTIDRLLSEADDG